MTKFLFLGFGGAVGTWARYLISQAFPNSTLIVNVVGSFMICFVMHFAVSTQLVSPIMRVTLIVGVFGGFTTYSAFSYETLLLVQEGQTFKAITSVIVMIFGCLLAGWFGQQAATALSTLTSP